MTPNEPQNEKVISLQAAKLKKGQKEAAEEKQSSFYEILMETMRQNSKNKNRLEQDRKNANKSVLKSYRIKK